MSPQVKSKSDPEALLNDLSSSLKCFNSTVREWTLDSSNNNSAKMMDNSVIYRSAEMTTRPARLGLGAKPQKNVVAGDGVFANLALKTQLTGPTNTRTFVNSNHKTSVNHKTPTNSRNLKNSRNPVKAIDFDEGGRASMIGIIGGKVKKKI